MAKLLFNLCHLQHLKIAQQRLKFPKLVQMFAKYFKTIPKIAQRLIKLCQSGKISTNLVTLILSFVQIVISEKSIHLQPKVWKFEFLNYLRTQRFDDLVEVQKLAKND